MSDSSELDVIFKATISTMPPTIKPANPSRPAAAAKKTRGRLEDNVEFKDIEPYLHLPQVEAADKLGFW